MKEPIWIAQLNEKDNENNKIVRLGYKEFTHSRYKYMALWDNNSNDIPALAETIEELKEKIQEKWGKWLTFNWL